MPEREGPKLRLLRVPLYYCAPQLSISPLHPLDKLSLFIICLVLRLQLINLVPQITTRTHLVLHTVQADYGNGLGWAIVVNRVPLRALHRGQSTRAKMVVIHASLLRTLRREILDYDAVTTADRG